MTALDTTQDIESLLAEADSLMNDMVSSLGESSATSPMKPPRPPRMSAGQPDEAAVNGIVDGLAAAVDAADNDAIIERIDAENPDAAATGDSESAVDGEAAEPADPKGRNAPEDWVAEASLTEDVAADPGVPSIPEESEVNEPNLPNAVDQPPKPAVARRLLLWFRPALGLPIHALILLDRPFARLSMPMKTCIGYIAIATLLTAAGTAVFANMFRAN